MAHGVVTQVLLTVCICVYFHDPRCRSEAVLLSAECLSEASFFQILLDCHTVIMNSDIW